MGGRRAGGAYLAEGRLGDARRAYAGVLRLAPGDAAAHVAAGRIALSLDDVDGALAAAKKALALLPNEANAELLLADGWARKGEVDLALEAYQKASGLDPENPAPLVRATEVCLRAGRLTSAKAFGQRAVLEFPAEAPAWIAEGDALAADGDAKAARKAYESARKAKNADVPAIDAKLARLR